MKRMILSLSTMAVVVMASASVALAATVNCPYSGTCTGTSYADTIFGTAGSNNIYAYAGNDIVYSSDGNDIVYASDGNDIVYGHGGEDILLGGNGNDRLSGWTGKDRLYDTSSSSSDRYVGFFVGASEDRDIVRDSGGTGDVLDLRNVNRNQVFMAPVDTSYDTDSRVDALLIERNGTTNSVLVRNYYDNSGASSPGTGAIEAIWFNDTTVGFLAL